MRIRRRHILGHGVGAVLVLQIRNKARCERGPRFDALFRLPAKYLGKSSGVHVVARAHAADVERGELLAGLHLASDEQRPSVGTANPLLDPPV